MRFVGGVSLTGFVVGVCLKLIFYLNVIIIAVTWFIQRTVSHDRTDFIVIKASRVICDLTNGREVLLSKLVDGRCWVRSLSTSACHVAKHFLAATDKRISQ